MQEVGWRELTASIGSSAFFAGSGVTAFVPIKLATSVTADFEGFPKGVLSQPPTILSAALLLWGERSRATSHGQHRDCGT